MAESNETKIVLLGKTGIGKSSLGNAILGDSLFKAKTSSSSETSECQAESKVINGVSLKVIDTPGFFDNNMNEEKLKNEIIKCIEECAPKIDAFLILLKVDRYTNQEKEVINQIKQHFSDEALKHAVVVFTHGDQLDEGQKIEEFVEKCPDLRKLVEKCGGRCHVVDNKYWKEQQDGYRSNRFQVEQLLNTIATMRNNPAYTNILLQLVGKEKQNWSIGRILTISAGVTIGALLGAFFGGITLISYPCVAISVGAVAGVVMGAGIAYNSKTPLEALKKTSKAIFKIGKVCLTLQMDT